MDTGFSRLQSVFGLVVLAAVAGGVSAHTKHSPHIRTLLRSGHLDRLPERPFFDARSTASVLVASPATIAKNGDPVTVTWSGVTDAVSNDWVGLYLSPEDEHTSYADFVYVTSSETWSSGAGSLNFTIVNLRRPLQFRYFQYRGSDAYNLIAVSNTFEHANVNEPVQGHVALTGKGDEMRVMFVTSDASARPVVQYGLQPGVYSYEAYGSSVTYTADMMCGSPANTESASTFIDPGYTHDVLLAQLLPATKYYYRFGTHEYGFSTERYFKTAPLLGNPVNRFIAYGDMGDDLPGSQGVAQRLMAEVIEVDTDFILHFGDISYAVGRGSLWETFCNLIDPIASFSPYMVSIGNHEYCYTTPNNGKDPSGAEGIGWHPVWGNYGNDGGGECAVPTYYRYHMPENGNSLFWYSFDYGNMHILQMSTEHDFTEGSPQYAWMEQDLKAVNRSVTPFLIVTGHRPMYNSEMYESDYRVCKNMRSSFESLLTENHVDVFLAGHYHSMEVTCAVSNEVCVGLDGPGVYHITVGSAGAWVDTAGYYDVPWRAYAEQTYGYERVTTTADELVLEFVRTSDNVITNTVRVPRRF